MEIAYLGNSKKRLYEQTFGIHSSRKMANRDLEAFIQGEKECQKLDPQWNLERKLGWRTQSDERQNTWRQ